jgi:hypothetical protein
MRELLQRAVEAHRLIGVVFERRADEEDPMSVSTTARARYPTTPAPVVQRRAVSDIRSV